MAKREATIEDLYRVPDKAEIVNGELVIMTPAGGLHGYAVSVIHASLFDVLFDGGRFPTGGKREPLAIGMQVQHSKRVPKAQRQ